MKLNEKSAKKRLKQVNNELNNLEKRIKILEWERRELINHLDLNKQNDDLGEYIDAL